MKKPSAILAIKMLTIGTTKPREIDVETTKVLAFLVNGITHGNDDFAVFPIMLEGKEATAIVHVTDNEDDQTTEITPLFVSLPPGMHVTDLAGKQLGGTTRKLDKEEEIQHHVHPKVVKT